MKKGEKKLQKPGDPTKGLGSCSGAEAEPEP